MPRPDKVAAVTEVKENLEGAAATLLTHFSGLTVTEMATLRAELRKANANYRIAKNTLTRLAADQAGIEGLADLLVGPTGLVFCAEDPVGPAKVLRDFAKDHPGLEIRGGYLEGEVLDGAEAAKLAELESREELLAKLAGLMYGALANTARLLNAPLEQQARLIQALVDAGGHAGAPAAEEAAEAPTAEAEEAPAAEAEEAPAAEAEEAPAAEAEEAPAAEAEDAPEEPKAAADGDEA